jgi:hypothetical protein
MIETKPLTIELIGGYTDKKGVTHRRVTIGKRITGKELFRAASDPQAVLDTQYNALILREKITEFGTLKMPVGLDVLLLLDSIDRDDLNDASNRFSGQAQTEDDDASDVAATEPELLPDNRLRLLFGYTRNGLTYDLLEFGRRITGMDEIEADKLEFGGVKRQCFLAAKQISRLSQSEGTAELNGPFAPDFLVEMLESLDAVDLSYLRIASEVWRQSFRRPGENLQEGGSPQRADTGDENRVERRFDFNLAD